MGTKLQHLKALSQQIEALVQLNLQIDQSLVEQILQWIKIGVNIMELNRDGDGFLVNTSDWSEEVMNQMASEDNFEITEEIKTYIGKAREMYNETGTVPAVRIFAKEFGMDRKASKLYEVFESGPMKKIAKYGGLPKPTGCV